MSSQEIEVEEQDRKGSIDNGNSDDVHQTTSIETSEGSPSRSTRPSSVEMIDTPKKEAEDADGDDGADAEVSLNESRQETICLYRLYFSIVGSQKDDE
jgi:hypothetical protein